MPDKNTYTIGGREYVQRPLVLGQWQQLLAIIKGLAIPAGASIPQLVEFLGPRLPMVLAVVLIEADGNLRRRFGIRTVEDPDGVHVPEWYQNPDVMLEIANEIHAGIDAESIMRVVDDFLSCNPASLILDRLTGIMQSFGQLRRVMTPTPSTASAPSSPEETSPSADASSGDTHLETASPTSKAESGSSSSASQ